MVDRVGAHVAGELVDERLGAHRLVSVPVWTAASVIARPVPPPHHSSAERFSANDPGTVRAQPSWVIVTGARR